MNEHKSTTESSKTACCGGPAPEGSESCCVQDAAAKAEGESGCGCAPAQERKAGDTRVPCC